MGRAFVLRRRAGARWWASVGLVGFVAIGWGAACSSSGSHPAALGPEDATSSGGSSSSGGFSSSGGSSSGSSSSSGGDASTDSRSGDAVSDVAADVPLDVAADVPVEACATRCSGVCTDLTSDSNNCGVCANTCGTGQACMNRVCLCTGGKTLCNGTCVDTTSDPTNCGFCSHNCQSTSCTAGLCPTTTIGNADNGQLIADMVIDSTNVYWSWKLLNGAAPPSGGVSYKAFSGGTKINASFVNGAADIRGIYVDTLNLYGTNFYAGSVFSTDLQSGFTSGVYDKAPNVPDAGVPSPDQPIDIVADAQNVYWVDYAQGKVEQASMAGGPIIDLATGRSHPIALALSGGYVYWIDFGTNQASSGSVNRVPVGGDAGASTTLAMNQDQPQDIATDGVNVYWTSRSNSGSVSKVAVTGGSTTVLAQIQGGPWAIVADQPDPDAGTSQTYVYWTNFNDNTVVKVPTGSTGPTAPYILASGQNNPVAIAVDRVSVYWANKGDGSLKKVAK